MPLVVRLEGTNVELGKKVLKQSGLKIISADNLADAAEKIPGGSPSLPGRKVGQNSRRSGVTKVIAKKP